MLTDIIILASKLDEIDQHDLSDRMEKLAMRPFDPYLDVKDWDAYGKLQEVTGNAMPIKHIQPDEVPLAVTDYQQAKRGSNRVPNGWAQSIPTIPFTNNQRSLMHRALMGDDEPSRMMASNTTGGPTVAHEQFHIDHPKEWMSEYRLNKTLGYGGDTFAHHVLSPNEIMARVGQVLHVIRNSMFEWPEEMYGDNIRIPDDFRPKIKTPDGWEGDEVKYLALKSGTKEWTVSTILDVADEMGWGPVLNMEPKATDEIIGRFITKAMTTQKRPISMRADNPIGITEAIPHSFSGREELYERAETLEEEMARQSIKRMNNEAEINYFREDLAKQLSPVSSSTDPNEIYLKNVATIMNGIRQKIDSPRDPSVPRNQPELDFTKDMSNILFALDHNRIERIIYNMIQRDGLKPQPDEDVQANASPKSRELAQEYATEYYEDEYYRPQEDFSEENYQTALVANQLGVPLTEDAIDIIMWVQDEIDRKIQQTGRRPNTEEIIDLIQTQLIDYGQTFWDHPEHPELHRHALPLLVGRTREDTIAEMKGRHQ